MYLGRNWVSLNVRFLKYWTFLCTIGKKKILTRILVTHFEHLKWYTYNFILDQTLQWDMSRGLNSNQPYLVIWMTAGVAGEEEVLCISMDGSKRPQKNQR